MGAPIPVRPRVGAATVWLVAALLVALAGVLSLTDIESYDYWWQLRTGQWIAENGSVPKVDAYTYTVPGNRYIDIHWLHQLGLHAVHSVAGHAGVVVAKFGLVLLVLGLLAGTGFRRRAGVSAVALALMLMLASGRFMPRPELPSFVLLAATLWLFERDRRPGAWPWAWGVIAVQLVWVNVHGLFAVGLALSAIYFAAELLEGAVAGRLDGARCLRLGLVGLGSAAVSFLNPNGVEGALYPLTQLGMIGPAEAGRAWVVEIDRLFSPVANPLARNLTLLLAGLALAAMLLNRRQLALRDPLVWGAFLFLTLSAYRNQALFGIVAAPILVRNANAWLDARPAPPARVGRAGLVLVVLLLLVAVVCGARGDLSRWLGRERSLGFGVVERFHPEGAVDWIRSERPDGRLFHAMSDGGYLLFHLFPDYPVMLDGRLEVFGRETFAKLNTGDPAAFARLHEEHGFGAAVLDFRNQPYDGLVRALHGSDDWHLVFADDVSLLFAPAGAGHRALDVADAGLFRPLAQPLSRADRRSVITRVRFYYAVGRYGDGLALWEAFADSSQEFADHDLLHVGLLLGSGRRAQAAARIDELGRVHADDPEKLVVIADILASAGGAAAAENLRRRAVALDPTLERVAGRITRRAALERRRRALAERQRAGFESVTAVALCLVPLGWAGWARHRQAADPAPPRSW